MKNKLFWLAAGLLLGAVLTLVCVMYSSNFHGEEKALRIVGDIDKNETLKSWDKWAGKESVICQGDTYKAVPLTDALADIDILGKLNQIYFIANDGFTVEVKAADADTCYLTYDQKIGWSLLAPKHPISTNAKDLKEIIMVSSGGESNVLTIIKTDGSRQNISMGQILSGAVTTYPVFQGKATVETGNRVYSSLIYTQCYGFPLNRLTEVTDTDYLLLETVAGTEFYLENNGHFTIQGATIDYVDAKGDVFEKIKQVRIYPYITLEQKNSVPAPSR